MPIKKKTTRSFKKKPKPREIAKIVYTDRSDVAAVEKKEKSSTSDDEPIKVIKVRTPRGRQMFGRIKQLLGDRRMRIMCTDGLERICRIPGKIRRRLWLQEGDIVLIEPWTVEADKKGDLVFRYNPSQSEWLDNKGFLHKLDEYE